MNLSGLLLPALLFITIGFIIGVLIGAFLLGRSTDKEETPDPTARLEEGRAASQESAGLPPARFEQVARLYREKSSGKLVTELDGKVYLTPESVPPEPLARLRTSAESWALWLGLQPFVPPPAAPAVRYEPASPPAFLQPDPAVVAAVADKPRGSSIVEQIDEILQEMLPNTPLAGQTIRLRQEPSLGVVVWVGTERYVGVESVPDPQVQDIVKAAVKKWEDSSERGLF